MNLETLEFVIYPDGRVKETVTGIVGRSCQEVTAAIEAELGVVLTQQATAEFFTQTNPVEQSVQQSQSFSRWSGGT
ncbi:MULTISPECIES: DUF2997 domain-containing protein [unclassified Synechocystis]|uniref:DUF2997 domain-containing protein n=1 Tax=unclassified Synechocystis TaxID=2640012 RepID=UPI0003FE082F|nr:MULTISPECIES: DUF2997 domain-containing protein [unclassified Synechocystis]AIE72869.1 Cellulase M-related protein [Synechocystis sp. PCC 6714]MCT0252647.1 DUF2997 domain-containing protein [Synechocystis sp. CS-94]